MPIPLRVSAGLLVLAVLSATALTAQTSPALVRHAPTLNGTIEGSLQQMTAESVTLNGGAAVTGDLLLPGSPTVRLNGSPQYGGAIPGTGSPLPASHSVTLNGDARLGKLRPQTDPLPLPQVAAPPAPTGTRSISLNTAGQSPGDFTSLRDLTLNGNAGQIAVPPGAYGNFTANGGSGFTLGVAGATAPAGYAFQRLTLNGNSRLTIIGPVLITLAGGAVFNASAGNPDRPEWLTLQIASGGLTLNGSAAFGGSVNAPNGAITLNGNSVLTGHVACDRLTINGNARLRLPVTAPNLPPSVSLASPANDTVFPAPASFTLRANASDPDGAIASVAFHQGATLLGQSESAPYQIELAGLGAGGYSFTARATDNRGAVATSPSLSITVNAAPSIALTGPPEDVPLPTSAPITLTATAGDDDGAIVRVEFYRGELLAGIVADPTPGTSDFTFTDTTALPPGTYAYHARTYDNLGGFSDSAPITVIVLPGLPYQTDFEAAEGYSPGALGGQWGWQTMRGSASVVEADAFSGMQSVVLAPGSPVATIAQTFAPLAGEEILFVDFFAKPVADADLESASLFTAEGAQFAFSRNGAQGLLQAFNGNEAGGGHWLSANFATPLNTAQQTLDWIRLTARLDFSRRTWDVYAAGRMVAADLGFREPAGTALRAFSATGHATAETRLDYLMAGPDNPLFEDINQNGIDDAWETARGLSLSTNNRSLSPSDNGLTVLQAYLQGADPNDFFGGQVPQLTIGGGDNQTGAAGAFNDQPLSVLVRNAAGTSALANAPVTFGVTEGGGGLAPGQTGTPSPATMLSVRTGPTGVARVWFKQPVTIGTASRIRATAGAAEVTFQSTSADPDFYHGVAPEILSLHDDSGEISSDGALSVLVVGPDGGPLNGAPVTFAAQGNGHLVAATPGGEGFGSVVVRSNSQGVARAYVVAQP